MIIMAQLNGKGVPSRKTAGAMGDIYTDTTTGKQYECVFAYRDNSDYGFDCQWKELPTARKSEPTKPTKTTNVPKTSEKTETKVDQPAKESTVANEANQKYNKNNKRTNYAAYSNKK